ncbi:MAG: hypothetical protein HY026_08140 [Deltaproteobacteria bacterium]|nr:hypothetical protein [Deltaproteobacteria bacterium]
MRYNKDNREKKSAIRIFLLCSAYSAFRILYFAAVSFSGERSGVKTVAVISGDVVMGRLKQPSGLFFDEMKKRLYVADSGNKRLVSFDSAFKYLAELSNETMMLPVNLVRDNEGRFYILDNGKSDIIFINLEKKIVEPFLLKGVPRVTRNLCLAG